MKKTVSRQEAAEILGCHVQTISNYIDRGILVERTVVSAGRTYKTVTVDSLNQIKPELVSLEEARKKVEELKEEIRKETLFFREELELLQEMTGLFKAADPRGRILESTLWLFENIDEEGRDIEIFKEVLKGKSIESIANSFDLTRQRIRKIFEKVLNRLPMKIKEELKTLRGRVEYLEGVNRELDAKNFFLHSHLREQDEFLKVNKRKSEILNTKIGDLQISVRAWNCLKALNMEVLGDLIGKTKRDISLTKQVGRKTVDELVDFLENYGLYLQDKHVRFVNGEYVYIEERD